MPDAFAEFCNQKRGYGFSYTLSLGTEPGVATVTAPPDFGRIKPVGPLDVYWQGRRFFRLLDARLDNQGAPSSTTSTPLVQWTIQDRRWKWQYGDTLDGDYNREEKDGKLVREKSPRELATLCFLALGEEGVDVSALPDKPRPPTQWIAASPKQELDRLCSAYNCAPAYSPFTNKAYLVKLGTGRAAPNDAFKSRSDSFVNRPRPDAIRIIGGNSQFQSALKVDEWLALEVDGTYVEMDQVSYKPAGGWETVWPLNFAALNTTYTDKATGETLYHRDLAQRSIWRTARISGQVAGGFSPDALKGTPFEPQSVTDLGPFTGSVLEKDPLTGQRLDAYARGVFIDQRVGMKNSPAKTRWPGSVQINSEQRIVTFDRPCFKLTTDNKWEQTTMELIAAYEVSHEGVPVRFDLRRDSTQQIYDAGELREHHREIVREVIEKTASATGQKSDNLKECEKQAKYYLDEIADQFDTRDAVAAEYAGLEKFSLDGKLRNISWAFSTVSTPKTSASWNTETNRMVLPWEERREARQQRQIEYAMRQAEGERRRLESRGAIQIAGGVK